MTSQRRPGSRRVPPKASAARATPRPAIGQTRRTGAEPLRGSRDLRPLAVWGVVAALVIVVVVVVAKPPAGPSTGTRGTNCPTAQPAALEAGQTRTVTINTPKGTIAIKVEGSLSPIAAGNFVALASCGFYNGVTFHRLVPGFVIQGGDPAGDGSGGPGYTIADETVTQPYKRGVVAMARSSSPNSQGSQFFIVLSDTNQLALTNTYAIFGSVVTGMDVVDAIAAMPNSGAPDNRATDPVPMTSLTVSNP